MRYLPFVLTLALVFSAAAQKINKIELGFEFRGLRTGVTESDIRVLLSALITKELVQSKQPPECFYPPKISGKICSLAGYSAFVTASNVVWTINYDFEDHEDEQVSSFLRAFTAKYGKSTISTHSYVNGLGAQIDGVEYEWSRGTQQLVLEEICSGKPGQHCIRITDLANAPPEASRLPKI